MPAVVHQNVDAVQASATGTDVYTVPTGQKFKVLAMSVLNADASARTFDVHRVASGGAASDANKVVSARNLAPDESAIVYEMIGQVVEGGGVVHVVASANSAISVHLSGLLLTE